jgi:two-component system, NtrC family, C4-dicarboxylate transport sensor histidine kinase DctB
MIEQYRRTRTDRHRALVVLVALLAFGTAILSSDHLAARRAVDAEGTRLTNVARLTASSFQRQVDKFRLVATTLSADSDVAQLLDTRTPSATAQLNERLANLSTALDASVIYLLDDQGTTIASSNWRQADSFLNENYQFRAYFKEALSRGEWEQYALGTRSRIPGLFVARRVTTGAKSSGVIVVKIRFDGLEREWAFSAGSAFVTSEQGVILVSSVPAWRFQTIRKLDEAEQNKLRSQVEFGTAPLQQNAMFAGNAVITDASAFDPETKMIAARERLPNGWSVYVLSPIDQAVGSARTLGRLLVVLGAGLLAALVFFSAFRRRAIIMNEQRENAVRIADLKDRLVQANKLSSLGQMAAGIGHEINQPLTAISIRAQNAGKLIETGRTAEAATAIDEISALTARMGAITGELRRFARRGDGRVGKVSLRAVLDGTQLLLGDRIRTTGTTLTVDAADIDVIGDQGRLEQVFVNLIQNAMDAMGDGGRINITAAALDTMVTITIRDDGPGIGADVRERLFHPFTTSKADGLGLGLVICRDIIADFGGELLLVPSKSGAAFALTLKIAA